MANHSLAETRSFILPAHNVVFASLQHPSVPHRTRVLVTPVPAVTPKWKLCELLRYERHWRCCSVTELSAFVVVRETNGLLEMDTEKCVFS